MIKIYKTYEIDDSLWHQIVNGFNECFDSNSTIEEMKHGYYISNVFGYAFHAIAMNDDGELMGFSTYSPTIYKNDIKVMVGGSVFVRPKFRKDIFIFLDLSTALRKHAEELGFHVEIGLPNKNALEYSLKLLRTNYIGELDYYILPRKISKCLSRPNFACFDGLSMIISSLILDMSNIFNLFFFSKEKIVKYTLKTDDNFYDSRFKNEYYVKIEEGRYKAYYRMVEENSANVAYIMDFRNDDIRDGKSLLWAVKKIIKKSNPDALMFVGLLRLCQMTLLKVPSKFIPKHLPMAYFVFDKKNKARFEDMTDVNNWNFSLMNFDVR